MKTTTSLFERIIREEYSSIKKQKLQERMICTPPDSETRSKAKWKTNKDGALFLKLLPNSCETMLGSKLVYKIETETIYLDSESKKLYKGFKYGQFIFDEDGKATFNNSTTYWMYTPSDESISLYQPSKGDVKASTFAKLYAKGGKTYLRIGNFEEKDPKYADKDNWFASQSTEFSAGWHSQLDSLGWLPGAAGLGADLINALWYVAQKDTLNAILSSISLWPVMGDGIAKSFKTLKLKIKFNKLPQPRGGFTQPLTQSELASLVVKFNKWWDEVVKSDPAAAYQYWKTWGRYWPDMMVFLKSKAQTVRTVVNKGGNITQSIPGVETLPDAFDNVVTYIGIVGKTMDDWAKVAAKKQDTWYSKLVNGVDPASQLIGKLLGVTGDFFTKILPRLLRYTVGLRNYIKIVEKNLDKAFFQNYFDIEAITKLGERGISTGTARIMKIMPDSVKKIWTEFETAYRAAIQSGNPNAISAAMQIFETKLIPAIRESNFYQAYLNNARNQIVAYFNPKYYGNMVDDATSAIGKKAAPTLKNIGNMITQKLFGMKGSVAATSELLGSVVNVTRLIDDAYEEFAAMKEASGVKVNTSEYNAAREAIVYKYIYNVLSVYPPWKLAIENYFKKQGMKQEQWLGWSELKPTDIVKKK